MISFGPVAGTSSACAGRETTRTPGPQRSENRLAGPASSTSGAGTLVTPDFARYVDRSATTGRPLKAGWACPPTTTDTAGIVVAFPTLQHCCSLNCFTRIAMESDCAETPLILKAGLPAAMKMSPFEIVPNEERVF